MEYKLLKLKKNKAISEQIYEKISRHWLYSILISNQSWNKLFEEVKKIQPELTLEKLMTSNHPTKNKKSVFLWVRTVKVFPSKIIKF